MTTKLEQDFETWWEREGQEFLYALNTTTDDDIKLVAEIAWKNGAYCAEQAEQEPVIGAYEVVNEKGDEWSLVYPAAVHRYKSIPEERITQTFYAAPVRTKDLTDDEIKAAYEGWYESNGNHAFPIWVGAKAVIAADREKNK